MAIVGLETMKTIKILGGGIAGLTAAINLKQAGIEVEVYERKRFCGKSSRDFQFIENWTFEADSIDALKKFNIQTDFYIKPFYAMEYISPSLKKCVKHSSEPVMYLIKRGPEEGSLDHALQKQATDAGIPIIFKSKLKPDEADIIATGKKEPTFIATGVTFPLDHPDKVIVLFDDRFSHQMYTYFTVNDQVGQIVVLNRPHLKDHKARLERSTKRFEEILNVKIRTITHRFTASGSFYFLKNARIDGRYYVGEAAGFQDCLTGFGIMYAFKSGYHAAQSIINNDDYNRRWQMDMLKPMETSIGNRRLFEKLSNDGYEKYINVLGNPNPVIVKLLGGADLQSLLTRLYNYSPSYLLHPMLYWKKLAPLYTFLLSLPGRLFAR
jgi:flavin-dependent dehydrogenase